MLIVKVKKFGVVWYIPFEMTAKSARGGTVQESRREGWTDARLAVGFCLGSGLFGSYNSD